jgi:PAS domain S-box-containing protein
MPLGFRRQSWGAGSCAIDEARRTLIMTADAEPEDDRRLHALAESMRAFAEATTDYDRLPGVVAEHLARLIGDGCFLFLLSEDGSALRPAAIHFREAVGAEAVARFVAAGPIRVDGPTLGARVVRTRHGVLVPRVDLDSLGDLSPAHAAYVADMSIRSLLVLPLEIHGRVLGFVSLARLGAADRSFSANDEAVARNLAEHAALAISNAQLLGARERELQERKRAEDTSARFVSLIQASGEFIAMAGLDGRILFVNEYGRRLLGLDADQDLGGLRLADFHTDDGMKRAPVIRETGRWHGPGQLRHSKTGELIDTQVSSFLVRDADGQPFGYGTVQHDMRETKELEAQLRQAQKMEAIGTLAGGIAHDFNNILGAILGNVELARIELPAEHAAVESLDEIAAAGRRAMALVRQILAFGRRQEVRKRVLRVADVVNEVMALLRSTISSNVELRASIAADTPNVSADPTQIHQVLVNLCTNAWHALERRAGRIEISLAGVSLEGADAGGAPAGRYARLRVSDDGQGMDAPLLERIFDPFFTTKAPGEGTGLGLSVVHGIVKDHGGTIRVESALGRGTTFEILLPAVEAVADAAAGEAPRVLGGRGQRLLYLDDEEPLVRMTQRLLGRLGYRVKGFTRADEAVEALRRDPSAFDVVLTDYNMPGLTGLQVARLVASIRPDLPVILTSGYVSDDLRERAALVGIKHVIYKPNTIEEMCAAIDKLVGPH